MKDVKDILNAYEENPSADVWKRLNAQLDAEMPVTGKVHRIHRVTVWKWMAAVLSGIIIVSAVVLGVLLHQRGNQDVIVENNTKVIENTGDNSSDAVTESKESVETDVAPAVMNADCVDKSRNVSDKVVEKPIPQPEIQDKEKPVLQPETQEKTIPNTKVHQVVLPPNSTLAKQLAADPVLKKLSDDSVDWSLPVHFSIPNLFTPNNDGVNDFFVIEGLESYSSPRLVVRDKNNKVVYQSESYKNTWNGGSCPDGVYSYEFTFSYNGIENQATGKVRIIRS